MSEIDDNDLSQLSENELNSYVNEIMSLDTQKAIQSEIATLNYFQSIDGVTIDPSCRNELSELRSELNSVQREATRHKSQYEEQLKDNAENRENASDTDLSRYNESVASANKDLRKARRELRRVKRQGDPLQAFLSATTGAVLEGNEKHKEQVARAKEGVGRAKERLTSSKEALQEAIKRKEKSEASREKREKSSLSKIKARLDDDKKRAEDVTKRLQAYRSKMKPQLDIVKRYLAIQQLKQSEEYNQVLTTLSLNGKDNLAKSINVLPDTLPRNQFVISLDNPLTLDSMPKEDPAKQQRVEYLDRRIAEKEEGITKLQKAKTSIEAENTKLDEEKSRLEKENEDLDKRIEDTKSKIEELKIRDEDTPETVLNECKSKEELLKRLEAEGKKDSPEYTQCVEELNSLQEKRVYLTYLEQANTLKEELSKLESDPNFNKDPKLLAEHSKKQKGFTNLKRTMATLPYAQKMSRLAQDIKDAEGKKGKNDNRITQIEARKDKNSQRIDELDDKLETIQGEIDALTRSKEKAQREANFGSNFKDLCEQLDVAEQENAIAISDPETTLSDLFAKMREKVEHLIDRFVIPQLEAPSGPTQPQDERSDIEEEERNDEEHGDDEGPTIIDPDGGNRGNTDLHGQLGSGGAPDRDDDDEDGR